MAYPWEVGEVCVATEDQVGQRAAGEVGGGDAVADVAAGPGEAVAAIEADGGTPIPRYAEWSAPGVRELHVVEPVEQVAQGGSQGGEDARLLVVRGLDPGPEVVRRPASAERQSPIRRALPVDHQMPMIAERRSPGESDPIPDGIVQRLRRDHQRVHRRDRPPLPRQPRREPLGRTNNHVSTHYPVLRNRAPRLDRRHGGTFVDHRARAARRRKQDRGPTCQDAVQHSAG